MGCISVARIELAHFKTEGRIDKLIIFDCDGVLVDSERLAAKVFAEQLRRYGAKFTAQECHQAFRGMTLPMCLAKLKADWNIHLPDTFLTELKEATSLAFEHNLRPVMGVEQVLAALQRRKIKYCVASNGGLQKVRGSLAITGLDRFFTGQYFSAEQVKNGKPAADLFLFAAQRMGYTPENALVVEDSELGLQAATAAQMSAIHYVEDGSNSSIGHPNGRRYIAVSSMPEVLKAIDEFCMLDDK